MMPPIYPPDAVQSFRDELNVVGLKDLLTPEDVDKAVKGNKAATARVRKAMQEVKAIAQEIRKEMLEMRDAGGGA